MTTPTQAQTHVLVPIQLTDAMRERMAHIEDGPHKSYDEVWSEMLDAAAALTTAAEVNAFARHSVDFEEGVKEGTTATIERCAQYHDNAARECDAIAAVNMDNDLGSDCQNRAIDHRIDAAAIRALANE